MKMYDKILPITNASTEVNNVAQSVHYVDIAQSVILELLLSNLCIT